MQPTPPLHPEVDPPVLGEHEGHVIYPMPVFARVDTPDPVRLATFFTTVLDFAVEFVGPDVGALPLLTHLRRAKYQDILVVPARDGSTTADASLVVTFGAGDADEVDALDARMRAAAPGATSGAADTPWNTRELTVLDPDGRAWTFTARSRVPMHASVDAAMAHARDELGGEDGDRQT